MIKPFTQFLQKKLPPKDQTVTERVDLEASKKVATNNGAVTEASGKDYKLFIQIVYIIIDFGVLLDALSSMVAVFSIFLFFQFYPSCSVRVNL